MMTDTTLPITWQRPVLIILAVIGLSVTLVVPAGQFVAPLGLTLIAAGISGSFRWYWWGIPAFLAVLTLAVALSPLWV